MIDFTQLNVWILTDGKAGHVNQSIGVAQALGVTYDLVPIESKNDAHIRVMPKAPDMIISTGRKTAVVARKIKQKFPHLFLVQMMLPLGMFGLKTKPDTWLHRLFGPCFHVFDVIAVPAHEQVKLQSNMVETIGAPHKIDSQRLASAHQEWAHTFAGLTTPKLAVLIGGKSKRFRFTRAHARDFASRVRLFAEREKFSLMVTPSRRTGKKQTQLIEEALFGPETFFWTGEGNNPYVGMLAHADAFVVTAESTSMVSEACSTGKPVFLYGVNARCQQRMMGKFNRFYRLLRESKRIAPLGAALFSPPKNPLCDADIVATFIREKYQ